MTRAPIIYIYIYCIVSIISTIYYIYNTIYIYIYIYGLVTEGGRRFRKWITEGWFRV